MLTALLAGCERGAPDIPADLKAAMAYGTMFELNKSNPDKEADLLVRLYQVSGTDESCFVETHGVCRYRYYVTVSTFDEQPEINLFKFTREGEVTSVAWKAEDKPDYAEIELSLSPYTRAALRNNKALKGTTTKVLLKLSPNEMEEVVQDGEAADRTSPPQRKNAGAG